MDQNYRAFKFKKRQKTHRQTDRQTDRHDRQTKSDKVRQSQTNCYRAMTKSVRQLFGPTTTVTGLAVRRRLASTAAAAAAHRHRYDVVIIGGGVMGSSVAYWLSRRAGRDLKVAVVERDPSYCSSATTLSVGGLRHVGRGTGMTMMMRRREEGEEGKEEEAEEEEEEEEAEEEEEEEGE